MNTRTLPLYATIVIFLLAYVRCWLQFPNILSTRVVGNLLTVLCSDRGTQPIVNAGSLY